MTWTLFTGCHTTSQLYKLGKKRAFKSLRKNAPKYDALDSLGNNIPVSPELARVAEQFICSLYTTAVKAGERADRVRWAYILNPYLVLVILFCQQRQKNKGLTPTSNSLYCHMERANYQTTVWKRWLQPKQDLPSPSNNGWEESENKGLKPVLISQDATPEGLVELTVCKCQKSACKSNRCVSAECLKCHVPRHARAWATSAARIPILKCKMSTVTWKDNVITL